MLLGAGAGIVATGAMTAGLVVPKLLGMLGEPPPRKLTRKIFGRLGVPLRGGALELATVASHFAYGAACGLLWALVPPRRSGVVGGAAYGTAIWAASYAGWIPKAGLMFSPTWDRPGRPTSMALAHVLFGGVLGATYGRWASRGMSRVKRDSFGVLA